MFLIQWSSPHQPISPPHHPPFFFLFLFSSFFSFLRAIKVIKIQMTVNHTLSKTQHSSNMKFSPTHQSLHSHLSDSCHKGDHPLAITSPKDDHTLSNQLPHAHHSLPMVSCICHDHSLPLSHIALILLSVHSVFCCFLQCLIPFDSDQVPQHVKGVAVWLHTQLLPLPVDDAQEAKVIQTTDLYFCVALALHLHAGSTANNFS